MKEDPNIEELLNSFIDGELTERQQIEVQRLITRDARVAQRLRELQKCKMLVGALPSAEAPAELAEEIKTSLQRKALLVQQPQHIRERAGARHLLVRRVLATAAMIGLVAVLAGVIYTIVAPESGRARGFSGRLELKTSALAEVDEFINRAIGNNGLLDCTSMRSRGDKRVYALSCSREELSLLLADLDNIWEKLDSATLFVETETIGEHVVDGVSAEQIADLITIPKPRLTGDDRTAERPVIRVRDGTKVHLTIVIGSE